jgi:SAM-dependent methyltransferase
MWWFAALHANLLQLYRRMPGDTARPLLDAGCGTGGFLVQIAAEYPSRTAVGLDADSLACARAAAKSGRPVCAGSINALPLADGIFGAIFSADVLSHAGVDERAALMQFHRCLGDDGVLVLSLPAYQWMMSRHDLAVSNVRRYTRSGIARLLQTAGFRVVFTGYWNMLLFPLMVLTRKLLPDDGAPASDVRPYSAPVEALCRAAMAIERLLLRCGVRLPFGGSVIAVAAKPAATTGV